MLALQALIELSVLAAADPDTIDQYRELVHVTADSRARFTWCFYYMMPMLHAHECVRSISYVRILRNKCINERYNCNNFYIYCHFILSVNRISRILLAHNEYIIDGFIQNVLKHFILSIIYFWNLEQVLQEIYRNHLV